MMAPTLPARWLRVVLTAVVLALPACDVTGDDPSSAPPSSVRRQLPVAPDAERLMFWVNHLEFAPMTDGELDQWKERGVDGFVSVVQWLSGLGGRQDFTPDPNAGLDGDNFTYQRQLRDTRILDRARDRGMKAYLGVYFANLDGGTTPFLDWFDDAGWSGVVLPRIRELAGAARMLGFAGVAFDQELYPQRGSVQAASWSAGYAGNTHSEAETRAKVKQRGQQLMEAVVGSFPDVEVVGYNTLLPESWEELVQEKTNNIPNAMQGNVHIDLWNGLTSVPGYSAIRLVDAIFYKSTQVRGSTWDTALQYNANRLYSLLSRRWDNWAYASSRLHILPFAWIDSGGSTFEEARSPGYVDEQLQAFRKWSPGGEIFNFAYGFKTFDYEPYADAMRTASTPGVVDSEKPTMSAATPAKAGDRVQLTGTSTDNLAVRAVRWQVTGGPAGAAQMTWDVTSGSYESGYRWRMSWTAQDIPLTSGINQIVVTTEDISGLTTTTSVSVSM